MPSPVVERVVGKRAERHGAPLCLASGKDPEPHPNRVELKPESGKSFRRPYLEKEHAAPAHQIGGGAGPPGAGLARRRGAVAAVIIADYFVNYLGG